MSFQQFPSVIFGTSGLGNLYKATAHETKFQIVSECIRHTGGHVIFDSAGKYGAGLALESLGVCLKKLSVDPQKVMISNKLGWLRTTLKTPEPTFEPGVWKDLTHDAIQRISYEGILECFHQGNMLLNGYTARMVSVHDPDEYLISAKDEADRIRRYHDIMEAYRALWELKSAGTVASVGIGAKDWHIIREIYNDVPLDWVMIANSMTIHSHPKDLLMFMEKLVAEEVPVINSAVFNGGFLTGSSFYNYRKVDKLADAELYRWREKFFRICDDFHLTPAQVAVSFARQAPGVKTIALNTTDPTKVESNVQLVNATVPSDFWTALVAMNMIDNEYAKHYLNQN